MAAMIWDNELQAWKEAATPRIWNPALEAYEDTTGLTWNSELEAWEERWNPDKTLWLYNNGDEYKNVTGGWEDAQIPPEITTMSGWIHELPLKATSSITLHPSDIKYNPQIVHYASISTVKQINLTAYNKLYVVGEYTHIDITDMDHVAIMCNETRNAWGSLDGGLKARLDVTDAAGIYELDISNVGIVYVMITALRRATFVIREVWVGK